MREVFVEDDLHNIEFVRVRGHSHLDRLVRGQPLLVCNLEKEVMWYQSQHSPAIAAPAG